MRNLGLNDAAPLGQTDLDSDILVTEVKRLRGKQQPLTATGLQAWRAEYTRSIEPARTSPPKPSSSNAASATSSTKPTASPRKRSP